jgi:hypothetical protein
MAKNGTGHKNVIFIGLMLGIWWQRSAKLSSLLRCP